MKQKALVLSTEGNTAVIEVARVTACEGCHRFKNGEGCAVCSLFDLKKTMKAEALNDIGAAADDTVEISTPSDTVLFYSAVVFILPLLIGIAAYFIAGIFLSGEGLLAAISAGAVLLTFVILHFTLDKRASAKKSIRIVSVCRPDGTGDDSVNN